MAISSSFKYSVVAAALLCSASTNGQSLSPEQNINLPDSSSAQEPLKWLGANSPWYAGPNVNDVSNDVPKGCTVEQAAYVTRHGSRYPDTGAFREWTTLYAKIQAAGDFTAKGSLSFLKDWKPVLENPTFEIAQESITGFKEAFDMGYALRTRYPTFYKAGDTFFAWSNLYPRVVQTASTFVRGYIGVSAATLGKVITVNATGGADTIGNSLSPSDSCPLYVDGNGGEYTPKYDSVYLPPITTRLNALITSGNLSFTTGEVGIFPYLCGFESQITGSLSPWCSIFTDAELQQYQYRQDLRYYYGMGPGTALPSTMMLPFLNSLVGLLAEGPGVTGKFANGTEYTLSNLIMAFANDGQINQLVAAAGVYDDQTALPADRIPKGRKFISSRHSCMRGTIAFERLSCPGHVSSNPTRPHVGRNVKYQQAHGQTGSTASSNGTTTTYLRMLLNDAVYPLPSCQDGPGKSCALNKYVEYVQKKYEKSGNWAANCNVTTAGKGSNSTLVVKGASFFTDLNMEGVAIVSP